MARDRKQRVVTRQGTRSGEELRRSTRAAQRERQTVPVYSRQTGSAPLAPSGTDDVFSGGRLIERVEIGSSATETVPHGLGYEPRRWAFLSQYSTASSSVSLHVMAVTSTTVTIRNQSAATVRFDLYVK